MGDADEDDLELTTQNRTSSTASGPAPWHRTAYDLATQCPSRRAAARRHTIVVCEPLSAKSMDPLPSPPPTPPATTPPPQSSSPTPGPGSLGLQLPHLSWSRSSLQEELFQSKQWQQECLSLTLEEIVHIRSVLTKAELESLPVEGQVKENAEKGKVCFLCMKTTFGIFRRRGHKCRLCQRTVCSKCHSQMRIPTEHFAHVPVVALSPSLLASPEEDPGPGGRSSLTRSIVSRLMAPTMSMDDSSSSRNSVGSAPSSPKLGCTTSSEGSPSTANSITGPASLPPLSTAQNSSHAATAPSLKANTYKEKLKGLQMVVCLDCKAMVLQIIKSSRSNRINAIRSFTLNLSPVY